MVERSLLDCLSRKVCVSNVYIVWLELQEAAEVSGILKILVLVGIFFVQEVEIWCLNVRACNEVEKRHKIWHMFEQGSLDIYQVRV